MKQIIIKVIIFLLLSPLYLYGWPKSIIKFSIEDSISLLPNEVKDTFQKYSSYMIDRLYSIDKHSYKVDPETHKLKIIEMIRNKDRTELQISKELAFIAFPIMIAFEVADFSEYNIDIERSPSLFIVEFDGYQPIGNYNNYLKSIKIKMEKVKFTKEYYLQHKLEVAKLTQSLYNDMVNSIVDLWFEIFDSGRVPIFHYAQVGEKRERKVNSMYYQPLRIESFKKSYPILPNENLSYSLDSNETSYPINYFNSLTYTNSEEGIKDGTKIEVTSQEVKEEEASRGGSVKLIK